MKILFTVTAIIATFFLASCSTTKKDSSVSITPASLGVVRNSSIPFSLYLTNKIEARPDVERKTSSNVFIIHTGHFLKSSLTKEENEAILASFEGKGINAINLTIEDFVVADSQGIKFEKYPYNFLNSSVVDLNEDNIVSRNNINPYVIHQGVALIGLSDNIIDKNLSSNRYIVSDYVLAVLRARKAALKESKSNPDTEFPLSSFILIHTIGEEQIQGVLERLPPNFINSLTN